MGLKDLVVTPLYIVLLTLLAIWIRPYVTNKATRRYFLPALWARFAGAIALGLVYQFYYKGGDTFNYWTHGSQWIWAAFLNDPLVAFQLIFGNMELTPEVFAYAEHISFFGDKPSYFIVRIAGFFDLLSFGTYSSTALFFASVSFSGLWMLYSSLQRKYPNLGKQLAFSLLFIPSVVLWGSGILKDSIALTSTAWILWGLLNFFFFKEKKNQSFFVILFFSTIIFNIKLYILLCLIPGVFLWLFLLNISVVRNVVLKILLLPLIAGVFFLGAFFAAFEIGKGDDRYSIDKLSERAWITAYDIRYYTGKNAGSGYELGNQDGTFGTLLKLAPSAINVSLFRPYLWEVKNMFMLGFALESLGVFLLTSYLLLKGRVRFILKDPFLVFCFFFSLLFSFAVGVSTYNFGTLMRYKMPMMPIYLAAIFVAIKGKNN